ncbi:MAG TPA: DUF4340 domain-containing protein [Pirellulaceae bacterium]|nr:DUF4340 domain-containing protein [Pirellulaceae bacterium]HMO91622.1 DUF4340 domain-containing protein [Pirellulaceae bacterium]HMP68319.1 DUF4340 domain-containing protein [Pirellulaceae bacterium]
MEYAKTISFVSAAVFLSLVALGMYWLTQPSSTKEFEKVGQPFFAAFDDPERAVTLEVSSLKADGSLNSFVVKKTDGVWRIPTHHNYPVDSTKRLADTAASFLGLTRESLADRRKNRHEEFRVLNPKASDAAEFTDPDRAGTRITMLDENDEVLFDLIVGEQVTREEKSTDILPHRADREPTRYYVRHPDEVETYRAELDVNLSTRFQDWIETDLLKVGEQRILRVTLDRYALEERAQRTIAGTIIQNVRVPGEVLELYRDQGSDWNLRDLDDATEQLNTFQISRIASNFTDVVINGVRPKFKYNGTLVLTADLKLNLSERLIRSGMAQEVVNAMQQDLLEKGYEIAQSPNGEEIILASKRGELIVGTDLGVVYTLNFGEAFVGDEAEVQIGKPNPDSPTSVDDANAQENNTGENAVAEDETDSSKSLNRYLMIRVSFDESLLGEKPQEPLDPVTPTKPQGFDEWLVEQAAAEAKQDNAEDAESAEQDTDAPPQLPEELLREKAEREAVFKQYQADLDKYIADMDSLQERQQDYRSALREFQRRARDGRNKVEELNARFGDWYYVISNNVFEGLQFTRVDIVSPLDADEADDEWEEPIGLGSEQRQLLLNRPNINFDE